MGSIYLVALTFSLTGLLIADRRYKLVWFLSWRRALKVLSPVYLLFIGWDLVGIGSQIFYTGPSDYLLGWQVLPNFPVEELLFLGLLVYTPLVIWQYLKKQHYV